MDLRPDNCPLRACHYLVAYGGRVCFGRLPEPKRHDELFNTHCRCEDGEPVYFNAADAYYEARGLIICLKDVLEQNLYNPCPELAISNPVQRLADLLKLGGPPWPPKGETP
jgi:hypothetical protein